LYKKWLDLGGKLNENGKLECPSCGRVGIDFQYVGDSVKRRGYLNIWCTKCFKGIHVDVLIPESAPMLDINAPADVVAARIPHFTWVLPDD
jgi:hypothetical protein